MDELHDRFHRLDRLATPALWNEAVGRAAELEAVPRRGFSPAMALIVVALLMAAMAGTIAVGGWVNRPEADPLNTVYSNGVLAAVGECGTIGAIDSETGVVAEVVPRPDGDCIQVVDLAWSSGGRWLAYSVSRSELGPDGAELWVHDTHSGSETLLQSCDACSELDISPDGSLVTYVDWNSEDSGRALVVARTDGSAVYRAPFFSSPGVPEFSPDGRSVAIPLTGGTSGIHVLDVGSLDEAATPSMRLLHGPVASRHVSWSPDGQWLAFDKDANGGHMEVWAIRTNGTDLRLLASRRGLGVAAYPVWSADSSTVAYVGYSDDVTESELIFELRAATLDGEDNLVYRSSSCCIWDFAATWSPDGEWIAVGVMAEDDSESGIFLVRPDGSDLRRLSEFAGHAAWQPLVEEP